MPLGLLFIISAIKTVVVLTCFPQLISGLATFLTNNQTFTYQTQDPFQISVPSYFSAGLLLQGNFDENATCQLLSQTPSSAEKQYNAASLGYPNVIIAIREEQAVNCGCVTMVEVCNFILPSIHPHWLLTA
jgi:hypothetical protein